MKREWNVNLPSSQTSTTYTLYTWDSGSSAFTQQESVQEDANAYNIVRNHLYGLGKRTTDDPGHGTDTEPTPGGDDEPVSLNNKHEVSLPSTATGTLSMTWSWTNLPLTHTHVPPDMAAHLF